MPTNPNRNQLNNMTPEQEEYRNRHATRAKRRKKRQMQRLAILGACLLAAVLLVVCVVLIVKAIINPKKPAATKSPSASISVDVSGGTNAITWPVATDPNVWNLILVNNQVRMPDGFNPERAVVSPAGHEFDARAADQLKQMVADCNAVEGNSLAIISAYRGPKTQDAKYNELVTLFTGQGQTAEEADASARAVEPPYGYSDHQTALAVDFVTGTKTETEQDFANTPEYQWLMANAMNYGFILRFPETKGNITGINFQPYHFRFVGVEDAKIISGAGICLEEYLTQMPSELPASVSEGASTSSPAA